MLNKIYGRINMMTNGKGWPDLSPEERREHRFRQWLSSHGDNKLPE
jgi:hypothetical protein